MNHFHLCRVKEKKDSGDFILHLLLFTIHKCHLSVPEAEQWQGAGDEEEEEDWSELCGREEPDDE